MASGPACFLPKDIAFASIGVPFTAGQSHAVLHMPVVTPGLLTQAASAILRARDAYLARLPVARIVDVLDATVQRWLDPDYALRKKAEELLPAVTGYSPEMVRTALPLVLEPFTRQGLLALLHADLGDPGVLDAPKPISGQAGLMLALGPRLTTHFLAGNIPAVPVESIIRALLAKSASLVKSSSRDPLFPALFVRSLAETDPKLAASIAVAPWRGGDDALSRAALSRADTVIAYGGAGAMEAVRAHCPPQTRVVTHGPKIGFAFVGRDMLSDAALDQTARQVAWDTSLFDQQGCVSPHAVFVESGGAHDGLAFAHALARAMADVQQSLPRGPLSPEAAAEIQSFRAEYEARRAAGRGVALLKSARSTAWTVAYEPEAAPLQPSCLNRVLRVISVDDLDALPPLLAPMRDHLQTAGVAIRRPRLARAARLLGAAGVSRVCPVGQMQQPPAAWRHDGRPSLGELLRWVTVDA